MKKAILFSGGYDSTYLLNDLMKTMKADDELIIVSIRSNLLANDKVPREDKARRRILDYLKAKYYNCNVREEVGEINLYGDVYNCGLSQPLMWLPFMYLMVSDECELYLSYICDDQTITHIDDIKTILGTCKNFQRRTNVTVKFPLRYFYKRDIISRLVHEDKFLFENATSCEGEQEEDFCGKCTPCKCLRSTLIDLICDEETTDEYRKYYENFLAEKFNTKVSCEDLSDNNEDKVKEGYNEVMEEK